MSCRYAGPRRHGLSELDAPISASDASAEPALIDLQWMGRTNCIAAWLTRDVLVDCGPATTLDTLLDALGDRQPRALFTHSHPLRPRWSRRRAGPAVAEGRGMGTPARRAPPRRRR